MKKWEILVTATDVETPENSVFAMKSTIMAGNTQDVIQMGITETIEEMMTEEELMLDMDIEIKIKYLGATKTIRASAN